ncbi:hypothetical protein [Clostridium ljungdahlii]|uniref:Uncharacterized protein n=1 Tax=Clostridium ljungdahlii TaxID=1538 RepID=A0A162LAQ4_9CLOT|nr:hypothetical protein [Clostridium ljungdahlii]OAA91066.1 hypothetical protein WY13_00896 [Clostridium ljungdahlii]
MNKIKLLYDVFKTVQEKEEFNVKIKLDAAKGETKVLSLSKEFSTNTTTGECKAKINSEFDCDGKKAKHESNTEFNMKDCGHHRFHHHIGKMGHMDHHNMGCCEHRDIKGKLSKITFILNMLNNLKVEEKDEISILSLNLKDIISEIRNHHKDLGETHKNFHFEGMDEQHKCCDFMKELLRSENSNADLNVYVNKNNEVEKIEVTAKGENSLNALVNFSW